MKAHPKISLKAVLLSLVISLVVECPFVLAASEGPHTRLGALGIFFFVPSISLALLFMREGPRFVIAFIAIQTALIALPTYWILTCKSRPAVRTALPVLTFALLLGSASAVSVKYEQRRTERALVIDNAGTNSVLHEIELVNRSLAAYRARYGRFPETFDQISVTADPPEPDHAGLQVRPMPMEAFFSYVYMSRAAEGARPPGYELYIEGKPDSGYDAYHYCTDETTVIHFDVSRSLCWSGPVLHSAN